MAVTRRRREAVAGAIVILLPVGPRDVRALGVRQSCAPAPSVFPDRVPGFLVDEQVKIERIGCRALEKMLGAEPGNLFVAKISFWDRPAFTMDQQVVSAAERKGLDVRHAFPAPRIIVPRLAPHDDADLVSVVEHPIRVAHIGYENVNMRALLAQCGRDSIWHIQIVFAIDSDEDFVTWLSLVIADKTNVAVTVLPGISKLASKRHQRRDIRRPKPAIS